LVEHLGCGDTKAGFVEAGGIGCSEDVGGEFGFGGNLFEPFALDEPRLVAMLFPLVDVVWFEPLAGFAEAGNDVGVRDTVENHVVYLVADDFWAASDKTVAAVTLANSGMDGIWIGGLLDRWIVGLG
jgi:hypothetical protein